MNGLHGLPSGPTKAPPYLFISDVLRPCKRDTVSFIYPILILSNWFAYLDCPKLPWLCYIPTLAFPNSLLTDSKKLNSCLPFIFIVSLHELFIIWSSVLPLWTTLGSAAEFVDAKRGLIPIIILDGYELEFTELYFAAGVSMISLLPAAVVFPPSTAFWA